MYTHTWIILQVLKQPINMGYFKFIAYIYLKTSNCMLLFNVKI